MAYILHIETSTKNCSVSVSKDGKLISIVEEATENYSHGEQLHNFIEKSIKEASITLNDIDCIAVGKGPGSYTGLRIGVSAAKGLCFSLNIPLISLHSLEILARSLQIDNGFIVPMIDARRMEVYSAVFDSDYTLTREIKAEVIDENSFSSHSSDKVYFVGDGAEKCRQVLENKNYQFVAAYPSSKNMIEMAFDKYKKSDFEDVAYFEPYYLKDFAVTTQKKLL